MATYEDILGFNLEGHWHDKDREVKHARIAEHLTLIDDITLAGLGYEWDLLRLYVRPRDGMILWATDAGCSCSSPFEGIVVRDLHESSPANFLDTFHTMWVSHGYDTRYSAEPWPKVRRDIAGALLKAQKTG